MILFRKHRIRKAREAYDAAEKALRDAVWRRDTRAQNKAQLEVYERLHDLMKLGG